MKQLDEALKTQTSTNKELSDRNAEMVSEMKTQSQNLEELSKAKDELSEGFNRVMLEKDVVSAELHKSQKRCEEMEDQIKALQEEMAAQ